MLWVQRQCNGRNYFIQKGRDRQREEAGVYAREV